MESATIMVLILVVGVVALLIWFEINSRRNGAQERRNPNRASSAQGLLKNTKSGPQDGADNGKAV